MDFMEEHQPVQPPLRIQLKCEDCQSLDLVEDTRVGDLVCTNCGLVAVGHLIDERSEWRSFADQEGDDPSRVGAAFDPLFDSGGMSTSIGKLPGGRGEHTKLQRAQKRTMTGEMHVQTARREIAGICDTLRLTDAVLRSALEVYKDAAQAKALAGQKKKAGYLACVYVAARREKAPKQEAEMMLNQHDIDPAAFRSCFKKIDKMYKAKAQHRAQQRGADLNNVTGGMEPHQGVGEVTTARGLVAGYMARMGGGKALTQFVKRVAERAEEVAAQEAVPWDGRNPATVACALVYGVLQIAKLQDPTNTTPMPDFEKLHTDCGGPSSRTIQDLYKLLVPYLTTPGKLVREKDASQEVLQQLAVDFAAANRPKNKIARTQ